MINENYISEHHCCQIQFMEEQQIQVVFSELLKIKINDVGRIGSYISVYSKPSIDEHLIDGVITKICGELYFTGKLGPLGIVDANFVKEY